MSDCERDSLSEILPTPLPSAHSISDVIRDWAGAWVTDGRRQGLDKNPQAKSNLDQVESFFNSAPFTAAAEVADALKSADIAKVNHAFENFDALSPRNRLEAACKALKISEESKKNPELPSLQIVTRRINDGEPSLSSLSAHIKNEVVQRNF